MYIHVILIIFAIIIPMIISFYTERPKSFSSFRKKLFFDISPSDNKVYTIIFTAVLIIVSGFRSFSVGTDLNRYLGRYEKIASTQLKELINVESLFSEFGYALFSKFISLISTESRFFIIITSMLITIGISYYIYHNSKIPWMSFYFYITLSFWAASMNVIRQFFAILLLMAAIKFVRERKLGKFLLAVLAATLFHKSAFFFLVIYPLNYFKITQKYLASIMLLGLFLNYFGLRLLVFISTFLGYDKYFDKFTSSGGKGMFLMLVVFLIVALYSRWRYKDDSNDLYIHLIIISLLLNVIAFKYSLIGRLMLFFTIHNIIMLPNAIYMIKSPKIKVLVTSILMIGTLYYYLFNYLVVNNSRVIPFTFF